MAKQGGAVGPRQGDNPANKEVMVQRFLDIQAEEIKLRKQELEIRGQEAKHNATYAEKALDAQERDRVDQRKHETRVVRDRLIFAGIVLGLIVVLSVVALKHGEPEIVKTLIQTFSSMVVGVFGGFFWGKAVGARPPSE